MTALQKLTRERNRLWWKCFRAQGVPYDYQRLRELRVLIEQAQHDQKVIEENKPPNHQTT